MVDKEFIITFWEYVAVQDRDNLRKFFCPDARINWHCTNERFTVEEYIEANCEYPGKWKGMVERFEQMGNSIITVTRVWNEDISVHACSFFEIEDGKIKALDEYWGDDGEAPEWRRTMNIGKPIN